MSMICDLKASGGRGLIPGECANCHRPVFESMWILDDAYNVWIGQCPHCKALNFLSIAHGLRGYSSQQMWLDLPTDEERADNGLPEGTPTRGSGGPADLHGTQAGEIQHRLVEAMSKVAPHA